MEQWTTVPSPPASRIGSRFILLGLIALALALLLGAVAAFKYLYPEFLEGLPFHKIRPLHVSLAVSWIFLTAIGGIYYHLPNSCRLNLFSERAAHWHFWIFIVTGLAILVAYVLGRFGGREYFAFPPALALPIFASWILFGVNYFKTVRQERQTWPVYYWMWGTGIVFFFLTFSESYLWLFPFFRENMVREITIQWKAYGALVGSWNMLVYGTALFVMERISGERGVAQSKMAFGLFFLGLFNLMFGWAHHAYPVPMAPWIRYFAYGVSMTELFILGKIIWDWRATLAAYRRHRHRHAYGFLSAADLWVFLNLIVALAISIPAVNLYTHGTHVTVAHAMGTTIGINTMILLASVFFILEERFGRAFAPRHAIPVRWGLWLTNGSLMVFLGALVAAGLGRGTYRGGSFQEMNETIEPFLLIFAVFGLGLLLGLGLVIVPALHLISKLALPAGRTASAAERQRPEASPST
jgi:nitric oxide reductase subunit B